MNQNLNLRTQRIRFIRFAVSSTLATFFLFSSTVVCAQQGGPSIIIDRNEETLRDFLDPEGEIIFTGQFDSLTRNKVTLRDETGRLVELRATDFSDEDREFFRQMERIRKQKEKAAEDAAEALAGMDTRNNRSIISACNKLKRIGPYAVQARVSISRLTSYDDEAVKKAVFIALLHICERSTSEANAMADKISRDLDGLGQLTADKPREILRAYASLGGYGYPYLRHVAFTGQLQTGLGGPSLDTEPDTFQRSDSDLNKFRRAAVEAFAEFEGEPVAVEALLQLLPVVEQPVNGVRDDATLTAILRTIGMLEVPHDLAIEALDRHAAEFSDVVTRSREQLQKAAERIAQQEEDR